jgi:uroporphyrinogen III methyltransferase/synthase
LITVRAIECLATADVVFYDYLVNQEVLRHTKPGARCIRLGGHREGRIWAQEEINQKVVDEAKAGRTVARLKGGDPSVFGRGAEEAEFLVLHGIEFELVPGVTTALAASAYSGIPITHRNVASAVAFVTGQQKADAEDLDYKKLAVFPGTLVFYMGVTSAERWSRDLIEAGKSPETPVALVRHVSLPTQQTYRCRLDEVAALVQREKLRPPIITIVGEVTDIKTSLDWFGRRPLRGKSVLVTRAAEQAALTVDALAALGAEVLRQPVIDIQPAAAEPILDVIARLDEFDWIVFSSANGVRYFFEHLMSVGDVRKIGSCRIASIGPSTDAALTDYRLKSDLVPAKYVAEQLAEELAPLAADSSVLLVRASRGREVLAERLRENGARVEQVVAYESRDVETVDTRIERRMASGEIDWVTVTSSAIAKSLVRLFGDSLGRAQLASISPVTSATLRSLGYEPAVEATTYNIDGVLDAICAAESVGT